MKQAIIISVFLATFVGLSHGQRRQIDPSGALRDKVMSQVVRRILSSYFKPARQPRRVAISDRAIKRSWLPEIQNVRFFLIRAEQVDSHESVYEFGESEFKGKGGSVWFGKYSPTAGGSGDIWQFDVGGRRLRLWRTGGQWGSSGLDHGPKLSH